MGPGGLWQPVPAQRIGQLPAALSAQSGAPLRVNRLQGWAPPGPVQGTAAGAVGAPSGAAAPAVSQIKGHAAVVQRLDAACMQPEVQPCQL